MSEHTHDWREYERTHAVTRFRCAACPALGYRSTLKTNQPVREYKTPPPETQPEPTAWPRWHGRNETGGYLPGGSGGRR